MALVTGAGSGIGRATVHRLVDEGAMVLAVDLVRRRPRAHAQGGDRPETVSPPSPATSPTPPPAPAAVAAAKDLGGRLDLLVNGAGILRFEHSHETTLDGWQQILAVNLTGTFLFCQAVDPRAPRRPAARS